MLSQDQSLLVSEREIELICGSLVTVQNGSLQLVHLTVKECLTSLPAPTSSMTPNLFVEPRLASLKLTLTCLKYIAIRCSTPVKDIRSKSQKLDLRVDPLIIENVRSKNPFLEYASFSWLSHLKDCDEKDAFAVAKAFRDAFDSRSTFCWVETCMFLQSDSASRLIIGLEVARDWAELMNGQRHCVPESKDCAFLCRWCSAIQRTFEEYGATLSRRPLDVHFIELRSIFVDYELIELYNAQSLPDLRESRVQLNYSNSHIRPQTSPPPRRKLRRLFRSGGAMQVGFFLYDESRDVYFWGDYGRPIICVQHAKPGKTLPHAMGARADRTFDWLLSSHAMSKDGKYIGVVYNDSSYRRSLTVIWEIHERLDFREMMQGEPWGRVVFQHTFDADYFTKGKESISFRDDHLCCTPSGLVHIPSARQTPIPKDLFVSQQADRVQAAFSGNGDYLFISNTNKCIRKISLPTMGDELDWTWDSLTYMEAISP